ncbi:hypothetical protein A2U01_0064477, partial [Trifolium medium]|nr:hypothetical protein [Trifolium medium]
EPLNRGMSNFMVVAGNCGRSAPGGGNGGGGKPGGGIRERRSWNSDVRVLMLAETLAWKDCWLWRSWLMVAERSSSEGGEVMINEKHQLL